MKKGLKRVVSKLLAATMLITSSFTGVVAYAADTPTVWTAPTSDAVVKAWTANSELVNDDNLNMIVGVAAPSGKSMWGNKSDIEFDVSGTKVTTNVATRANTPAQGDTEFTPEANKDGGTIKITAKKAGTLKWYYRREPGGATVPENASIVGTAKADIEAAAAPINTEETVYAQSGKDVMLYTSPNALVAGQTRAKIKNGTGNKDITFKAWLDSENKVVDKTATGATETNIVAVNLPSAIGYEMTVEIEAGDYYLTSIKTTSQLYGLIFTPKATTTTVDKTDLNTAITAAKAITESTETPYASIVEAAAGQTAADIDEGTKFVDAGIKTALDTALATAEGLAANEAAEQTAVDQAAAALNTAVTNFVIKTGTKPAEAPKAEFTYTDATADAAVSKIVVADGVVTEADGAQVTRVSKDGKIVMAAGATVDFTALATGIQALENVTTATADADAKTITVNITGVTDPVVITFDIPDASKAGLDFTFNFGTADGEGKQPLKIEAVDGEITAIGGNDVVASKEIDGVLTAAIKANSELVDQTTKEIKFADIVTAMKDAEFFDKGTTPGPGPSTVDKTALTQAIAKANAEYDKTQGDTATVTIKDQSEELVAGDLEKDKLFVLKSDVDIFKAAIDDAQAVADNNDATQTQVDDQVKALEGDADNAIVGAIDTYKSKIVTGTKETATPVNKDALTAAITAAGNAKTGVTASDETDPANIAKDTKVAPQSAIDALEAAITKAQGVADKTDATQTEVDDAVTELNGAVTTFGNAVITGTKEEQIVNLEALADYVEAAISLAVDGKSVKDVTTADNKITITFTDKTSQTIALVVAADLTDLKAAITAAEAKMEGVVVSANGTGTDVSTDKTWVTQAIQTALKDALTAAESIDAFSTEAEITAATTAITDATTAYVPAPGTQTATTVDKTALTTAVGTANTEYAKTQGATPEITIVDPATETSDIFTDANKTALDASKLDNGKKYVLKADADALNTAIADAQVVIDNADATQQVVNDAATAIGTATTTFKSKVVTGTKGAAAVDKTALKAALAEANAAKEGVEASDETDPTKIDKGKKVAPQAAITAFETAIAAAKAIDDKTDAIQTEVDAQVTALKGDSTATPAVKGAIDTFKALVVTGTKENGTPTDKEIPDGAVNDAVTRVDSKDTTKTSMYLEAGENAAEAKYADTNKVTITSKGGQGKLFFPKAATADQKITIKGHVSLSEAYTKADSSIPVLEIHGTVAGRTSPDVAVLRSTNGKWLTSIRTDSNRDYQSDVAVTAEADIEVTLDLKAHTIVFKVNGNKIADENSVALATTTNVEAITAVDSYAFYVKENSVMTVSNLEAEVAAGSGSSTTYNKELKATVAYPDGKTASTLAKDDEITVTYSIKDLTNINNYTFYIDFNSNALEFVGPVAVAEPSVGYEMDGVAGGPVPLIPTELITQQAAVVPANTDLDYPQLADETAANTKTAAQLGRIKLAGVAGLDSYEEIYETNKNNPNYDWSTLPNVGTVNATGNLFAVKFKVKETTGVAIKDVVKLSPLSGETGVFFTKPVTGTGCTAIVADNQTAANKGQVSTEEITSPVKPGTEAQIPTFTFTNTDGTVVCDGTALSATGIFSAELVGDTTKSIEVTIDGDAAVTVPDMVTAIQVAGAVTGTNITVTPVTGTTDSVTISDGTNSVVVKFVKGRATVEADKTALNDAIAEANAYVESIKEATSGADLFKSDKWATKADRDAFKAAIATAQGVADKADATQAEVDKAVTDLAAAKTTFEGKVKPGDKEVTKDTLTAAIAAAQAIADKVGTDIVVGTPNSTPVGKQCTTQTAVDALNAAITTAKAVPDTATAAALEAAVTALNDAVTAFNATLQDGQSSASTGAEVTISITGVAGADDKGDAKTASAADIVAKVAADGTFTVTSKTGKGVEADGDKTVIAPLLDAAETTNHIKSGMIEKANIEIKGADAAKVTAYDIEHKADTGEHILSLTINGDIYKIKLYSPGDTNGNGIVNAQDATAIIDYLNHKNTMCDSILSKTAAKVRNGVLNATCATGIIDYLNNKVKDFEAFK